MASEISAQFGIRSAQNSKGSTGLVTPAELVQRAKSQSVVGLVAEPKADPADSPGAPPSTTAVQARRVDQESGNDLPQGSADAAKDGGGVADSEESALAEEVNATVNEVKNYFQNVQRELQFEIDQDSNRTIVRVVDSHTGDVVRQIPAEEFVRLAKRMEELDGVLMSERV